MARNLITREMYGLVDADDRGDWLWHMANRITTLEHLRTWIEVTPEEEEAIERCKGVYRWSVTPYYASLMSPTDDRCPIRRQAVPGLSEFEDSATACEDPVGDRFYRKTNRVVHKYPDRVIFLVTRQCPVYCRHCTRKYHTTAYGGTYFGEGESVGFEEDLAYIRSHPEIRDVLLTGGDPLSYSDAKLAVILDGLRAIPHVEIIRIGSRYPVLLPQRITPALCELFARSHPLWLNTHFNHAGEITPEAAAACDRLLRHGIPVQNQSVLLRGINDELETMRDLLRGLLKIRVRPYYLYQCDDVTGVSGFATSVERGRSIMEALHGRITGFAVPSYILTTLHGKVPLQRSYLHQDDEGWWAEGYTGQRTALGALEV